MVKTVKSELSARRRTSSSPRMSMVTTSRRVPMTSAWRDESRRSAIGLRVGDLQGFAAIEIELEFRAPGPSDVDLAKRDDAGEVGAEVARDLGRRLGGDEDA